MTVDAASPRRLDRPALSWSLAALLGRSRRRASARGRTIIVLPFENPDAGTAPRLDARRRRDPARRDPGGRGRNRDRSRRAPAGIRSAAAAGRARRLEPRLDDQGRADGGRIGRDQRHRRDAGRSIDRARAHRAARYRQAAARCRSARAADGSLRHVRVARASRFAPHRPSRRRPGERLPPTPKVFELYVKGLVAETPSTALAFLEQALKAAPQFDRARLAIWDLHSEASDHQKALDVVSAIRPESRYSREGRFRRALSLMNLKRFDDALQTLRAMQNEEPSATVANAIGVAELRRAHDDATGPRHLLLQPGLGARSGRWRFVLQPRLRLLARQGCEGRDLLAARSRAPRSRRWRCALHSRRGVAADRLDRRGDPRARARRAPVVEVRGLGERALQAATRCREASNGCTRS